MADILEEIVAHKRVEVAERKQILPQNRLEQALAAYMEEGRHTVISMKESLRSSRSGIIAEFKRRSPSKGWIKAEGRADQIPLSYAQNGASALSILTDSKYFGGSLSYLEIARGFVSSTPILRKDFIIEDYQLYEARLAGADAVLLIAADLTNAECRKLAATAHSIGLETLLEIHTESELDYVGENIDMVGVNNRNLGTFHTDVANSYRLASQLPKDYVLVSEPAVEVFVDELGQSSVSEVVFQYLYAPATEAPTEELTETPTEVPTEIPTEVPTEEPTEIPTEVPTEIPTEVPTEPPTEVPTQAPADVPTEAPTEVPVPDPVLITVRYLDENGQPVADDEQVWCAYGDTLITANPINLKADYQLIGGDTVTVHLDENGIHPTEAAFTYAYVAPAPKVALVNVKYLDPDGNVFYSYTATCAEGQENPVSLDWNQIDSSLGYELASDSTVYVTVDKSGATFPAEVIFQFRNEINADVTIYFRDALTGQDVASPQRQLCFIGSNTVDARPVDLEESYELIGESSQTVLLGEDGELTPSEIVFQYVSTATPTPVPQPPAFDTPMDAYFYPTGTSIRVRSTPTTAEDNIVGAVNNSDLGHILGQITSEDGKVWYAVEINGMMGYMSETVVRFLTDAELAALFNYTLPPTQPPTPGHPASPPASRKISHPAA